MGFFMAFLHYFSFSGAICMLYLWLIYGISSEEVQLKWGNQGSDF